METNKKIIKAVSELIFYESSRESEWLPIDITYLKKNGILLNKISIEEFIVYSFNNFPEIYNHRLLLCIIEEIKDKSIIDLFSILEDIETEFSKNSFVNFFKIFLRIDLITLKSIDYPKMDEDDIDFIKFYDLNSQIDNFKRNLIK